MESRIPRPVKLILEQEGDVEEEEKEEKVENRKDQKFKELQK